MFCRKSMFKTLFFFLLSISKKKHTPLKVSSKFYHRQPRLHTNDFVRNNYNQFLFSAKLSLLSPKFSGNFSMEDSEFPPCDRVLWQQQFNVQYLLKLINHVQHVLIRVVLRNKNQKIKVQLCFNRDFPVRPELCFCFSVKFA